MSPEPPRRRPIRRVLWRVVAAAILAGIAVAYAVGLRQAAGLEMLFARYDALAAAVAARPVSAAAAFFALYAVAAAVSLPGVLWLSIAAGLLFGWGWGAAGAWAAAWTGSMAAYAIARRAAGPALRARFHRFAPGFDRDAAFYVVTLRLLPIPYFLVNLAAGALGAPLRAYAAGSAVGFAPQAIAYAALGAGARAAAARGELDLAALTDNPALIGGFAGLAALSAATLLARRRLRRTGGAGALERP